jgi:hypothetical protein
VVLLASPRGVAAAPGADAASERGRECELGGSGAAALRLLLRADGGHTGGGADNPERRRTAGQLIVKYGTGTRTANQWEAHFRNWRRCCSWLSDRRWQPICYCCCCCCWRGSGGLRQALSVGGGDHRTALVQRLNRLPAVFGVGWSSAAAGAGVHLPGVLCLRCDRDRRCLCLEFECERRVCASVDVGRVDPRQVGWMREAVPLHEEFKFARIAPAPQLLQTRASGRREATRGEHPLHLERTSGAPLARAGSQTSTTDHRNTVLHPKRQTRSCTSNGNKCVDTMQCIER